MILDPSQEQDKYLQILDQLTLDLSARYGGLSRPLLAPVAEIEAWDDYLLELNSYYYSSFVDRYVPMLREMITTDIRALHNLELEEESLKKLLFSSLMRQARTYNGIKFFTARLQVKQQELIALQAASQNGLEARGVELIYIWKDLKQALAAWLAGLRHLQDFIDDKPMQSALQKFPHLVSVGVLLEKGDFLSPKAGRELNRLLSGWQLLARLLGKFPSDPWPAKSNSYLLDKELEKIDLSWDNRKTPAVLRSWYTKHVQPAFRLYRESLRLAVEKNERRFSLQIAGQMEDWLQAMLLVIEKGLGCLRQDCLELIHFCNLFDDVDRNNLSKMIVFAARTLQSADESVQGLVDSPQATYANYTYSCSQLVGETSQYLTQQLEEMSPGHLTAMGPQLLPLRNLLDGLEVRLEQFEEQNGQGLALLRQNSELLAAIDSCLQVLRSHLEDLERQLSSSYLQQAFAGLKLRIEHLSIATGAMFPASYMHLVEAGLVNTQPASVPEGRILSAGGDIFIVHLDGQQEMEIPEITIAVKG
ncbi:MAG: hypothetical protein ABRQ23_03540 [Syntrophomonadaceae bacterium]